MLLNIQRLNRRKLPLSRPIIIEDLNLQKKFHTVDISPADIAAWQTEILNKGLSESYSHTINIYLKAIFAYAVEYVGLSKNPCTKSIGSLKSRKIDFWTPEEYKLFSEACKDNIEYFTLFELLYYTGMRVGEALALTLNDIDFKENTISITKTYYRVTGKDLINPQRQPGVNALL